MSLFIKEQNGILKLEGKINKIVAKPLEKHLKHLFKIKDEVIINIDNVSEIDRYGVAAIKSIYMYSLIKNIPFHITGNGCRDIHDHIKSSSVA